MLSKEVFIMLQHYIKEGLPKSAIARKLGVNRRTIQRYIKSGKTEPVYRSRPPKPCILDRFKAYLRERLKEYPELSAVRLFHEIIPLGYCGKITTVRNFVRAQRPDSPLSFELRFEVNPGEQAQADFATFKTDFGTVYAFLAVLSWSRYLWVHFYSHQDQLSVFNGLHRAFIAYGGIPRTVLFDRMKAAVARSGNNGTAVFNEEMMRFASHYGFRPKACQPYRAKTKGRVERAVSYLRHNFFYGRRFNDIADLNLQLEKWLLETANSRLHGTTNEAPSSRLITEQYHLSPLPTDEYVPFLTFSRRVSRDGYVSYNGNDYSLPEGLGRPEIEVKASLSEIQLYQSGRLVAVHPVISGRGMRQLAVGHRRWDPTRKWQSEQSINEIDSIEVERRPLEAYEEVLR
ncbi:MAG: IS21 family transposase [Limnochordia bacterium]|nr:IS21 family transposase [Limnochordia bacterium]